MLDAGRITIGRGKDGSICMNSNYIENHPINIETHTPILESMENLRRQLQEFKQKTQSKIKHCRNERQTEQLLVEPYLNILGVDTQDPERVQTQFETGIGKGVERVDYAVLERGQPIWLIEVKSAQTTLPKQLPPQLKRYAVDTKAPFASLTNGIYWYWYTWNNNRGLEESPFLEIDVRCHPADLELDWLATVRRGLHEPDAEHKANACGMAGHLVGWLLRSVAKAPSEDLLCLALQECRLPTSRTWIDLASAALPKAWKHCMNVQPQLSSNSDWGAHLPAPEGEATAMSNVPRTGPSLETGIHTYSPVEPVKHAEQRKTRYCVSQAQGWVECKNATVLMLDIIKWCAQQDMHGEDNYYHRLSRIRIQGRPFLIKDGLNNWDRLPLQEKRLYARETVNGWHMYRNLPNKQKPRRIDEILTTCMKRDGTHLLQGQDLWVEMPNTS
ncbi:MAG: type I restriction enzyme HsdR N-terminal domain-containing protein [Cyanobacteria bacterium MAG CAR2_bin_4]|nr:type I restriction enzyme HsdR N-terminal domain-containing protein [Cyanobacteria bacterium MAG CAR2_bin_4]